MHGRDQERGRDDAGDRRVEQEDRIAQVPRAPEDQGDLPIQALDPQRIGHRDRIQVLELSALGVQGADPIHQPRVLALRVGDQDRAGRDGDRGRERRGDEGRGIERLLEHDPLMLGEKPMPDKAPARNSRKIARNFFRQRAITFLRY
ncbi:hypothetical protein D3C87_1575620 [compost metagenome]